MVIAVATLIITICVSEVRKIFGFVEILLSGKNIVCRGEDVCVYCEVLAHFISTFAGVNRWEE